MTDPVVESMDAQITIGALLAAGGTVAGGLFLRAYQIWRERRSDRVQDRDAAIVEYKAMIDQLRVDLKAVQAELRGCETRYDDEVRKLTTRYYRSQQENQALRTEVQMLTVTIAQFRVGFSPLLSPGDFVFALVIADQNGKIVEANPGINLLFHWAEDEVVDHNVEMLIPVRYRLAHQQGMIRLRDQGGLTDSRRILSVHGLTREGEEFPLDIQMCSWKADDGLRVGAMMRRRWSGRTPEDPPSVVDLPVAPAPATPDTGSPMGPSPGSGGT